MSRIGYGSTLFEILEYVASERVGVTSGIIGPEDFVDPATGEEYLTAEEEALGLLQWAIEDIQRMAHHQCQWDEDDICTVCGADGRA